MNGVHFFRVPNRSRWCGLLLIVNETVPVGGCVITDAEGDILAGGNVHTGMSWLRKQGDAAYIHASEPVVRELIRTEHDVDTTKRLH